MYKIYDVLEAWKNNTEKLRAAEMKREKLLISHYFRFAIDRDALVVLEMMSASSKSAETKEKCLLCLMIELTRRQHAGDSNQLNVRKWKKNQSTTEISSIG